MSILYNALHADIFAAEAWEGGWGWGFQISPKGYKIKSCVNHYSINFATFMNQTKVSLFPFLAYSESAALLNKIISNKHDSFTLRLL